MQVSARGNTLPHLPPPPTLRGDNPPELLPTQYPSILSGKPSPTAINSRIRCGVRFFAFTLHFVLCTLNFWIFPSSTTTTPAVLENSRNFRQKSVFLDSFLRMLFIFFWRLVTGN
jgi:hypothetical protein